MLLASFLCFSLFLQFIEKLERSFKAFMEGNCATILMNCTMLIDTTVVIILKTSKCLTIYWICAFLLVWWTLAPGLDGKFHLRSFVAAKAKLKLTQIGEGDVFKVYFEVI